MYLAEASTPVLNISWMMYKSNLADTKLFMATILILVGSFFCCRVLTSPYILYSFVVDSHMYGDRFLVYSLQLVIVIFFMALNLFWFWKLIYTFFIKKAHASAEQGTAKGGKGGKGGKDGEKKEINEIKEITPTTAAPAAAAVGNGVEYAETKSGSSNSITSKKEK